LWQQWVQILDSNLVTNCSKLFVWKNF